jgi:hypothetical protein
MRLGRLIVDVAPPVTGWWVGPGFTEHNCALPKMPRGAPAGLIFRCGGCRREWRWNPS